MPTLYGRIEIVIMQLCTFTTVALLVLLPITKGLDQSRMLHLSRPKVMMNGKRKFQFDSPNYDRYVQGQPVPGMIEAMRGYHLFEGDPVNQNPDPGVKQPIFEIGPLDASTGETLKIHDVYTVSPQEGCDVDSDISTSWKMYDYMKDVYNTLLAGGGLKTFVLTVDIKAALRISGRWVNLERFFVEEHGTVTLMHATCFFYQVQIEDNFVPLKFHTEFQNAIRDLYYKSSDSGAAPPNGAAMLKQMFETYGTHYSKNTWLGSKIVAQRRLTGYQRSKLSVNEINICVTYDLEAKEKGAAGILHWFGIIEESTITLVDIKNMTLFCHEANKVLRENKSKHVDDWSFQIYGSEKKDNITEWTKQIVTNPYAVKRELKPWVLLLDNKRSLIGIDPNMTNTKRLLWVKEMYSNYCALFNASCDKVEKCYINDPCNIHDVCSMENGKALCTDCHWYTHDPPPKCRPTGVGDTCLMRLSVVHWTEGYIRSNPLDRNEAAAICQKWNGTLPVINGDQSQLAVDEYLEEMYMVSINANKSVRLWVDGMQEDGIPSNDKNKWINSDGSRIRSYYWNQKEPNGEGACIRYKAKSHLEDAPCSNKAVAAEWNLVCQLPHDPRTADKSECPVKNVMDRFGCYWGDTHDYCFVKVAPRKTNSTAYDAYDTCWSDGLYLPVLRTPEMQRALLEYMKIKKISKVWVDGHPNSEPKNAATKNCATKGRNRWFFNDGASDVTKMPQELWCSDSPSNDIPNCKAQGQTLHCPRVIIGKDKKCLTDADCKDTVEHVVCQVSDKVLMQGYDWKNNKGVYGYKSSVMVTA